MATKIANAVAVGLSLDTTEFRKDINLAERLIKQVQSAYTDYSKTLNIVNEAAKQKLISERDAIAVENKLILTSEKRQAALREEARRVQELTTWSKGLQQVNTTVLAKELERSRQGAEAFAAGLRAMSDRVRESTVAVREAQAAVEGWANGLKRINTTQLSQNLQRSKQGADAFAAGLKNMGERARANALAIRESQAAVEGWANGLKQISTTQLSQELLRSKQGADAFAAGLRAMSDRARESAIAIRQAQAAVEGWANGLRRVGTTELAQSIQRSRQGADAFAAGLRVLSNRAAEATANIRISQAAVEGWDNSLRRISTTQLAQELLRSKQGADAFAAGLRAMSDRARESAAAIRQAQAAVEGWANGLQRIGTTQLSQDLQRSRQGADAFAAGLRIMSDRARESAAAIRQAQAAVEGWDNGLSRVGVTELARDLQRSREGAAAWAAGLDRISESNRRAEQEVLDLAAAQRQLREEGAQYLQQFETRQQRINRQLAEASQYYRRGAIDAVQYAEAVRSINRQNNAVVAGFNQFKGAMLTLVGPLVVLVNAWEAFKTSLRLSAELDAARARFKVFTGSVSEANRVLNELRTLSSSSPISFAGAQRATTTMLQFGVATEDVVTYLRQIAEITGGDTQRMENLALAFSQTAAAGRLMGQELLQSVNAGFNPLKVISEQTGESMSELKKRMEEGGVSFREVAQAYKDATKEGGRYNGLLKEVANTTSGRFTRAGSELEKLGTAFGDLLKPATDGTLISFISFSKQIREEFEKINGTFRNLNQLTTEERFQERLDYFRRELDLFRSFTLTNIGYLLQGNKVRDAEIQRIEKIIAAIEEEKRVYEGLEEVRKRIADGGIVTISERKAVEEDDKRKRELRKVNEEEFKDIIKQRDEQLKLAKTRFERLQIQLAAVDRAGDGFFQGDAEVKRLAAMREEFERLTIRAENAKRSTEAFGDALRKARESIIDSRYGDNANIVKLLREQSVGDERRELDRLIDQGAAYKVIFAAANETARAEAGKLIALEKQSAALTKQAESAKEAAQRIEKLKEDLESLNSQSQFLRDSRRLGEQEARLRQLMRDDKLVRADAKRVRDAEARVKAEEKIKEIREAAIESEKSSSYSRLVEDISKLQQQLRLGFITRTQFEIERNKVIDAADRQQIQVQAPRAVQAGSAELLAMQAEKQAQAMADQFNLANRAFLLQKATADATGKTARILDEIKDNLGVLPAP